MSNVTETVTRTDRMNALKMEIVELFGVPILSGSWVNLPETERKQFAADFLSVVGKDSATTRLATRYNTQVWDGWENGTVPEDIKGTRERRDPNGDKPGRKAKVLTPAEILFGESS